MQAAETPPPMPDNAFVKPERRKKPSSGRGSGKQPGAPGAGLAMLEHPDETVDVFPPAPFARQGPCGNCGRGLDSAASMEFARRQCHDIPPASVIVTETRWPKPACGCGFVTAAAVPGDVPDAPYYGPNLACLCIYLLVCQHIPVERCAELIPDVTGAAVSKLAARRCTDKLTLFHARAALQGRGLDFRCCQTSQAPWSTTRCGPYRGFPQAAHQLRRAR